jgi:hypothetical protein
MLVTGRAVGILNIGNDDRQNASKNRCKWLSCNGYHPSKDRQEIAIAMAFRDPGFVVVGPTEAAEYLRCVVVGGVVVLLIAITYVRRRRMRMSGTKVEFESLNSALVEEAGHVLSELSTDRDVTVRLSPDLAHIMARFLRAATEEGAVAFGPVSPEITPKQAAKILDIDVVLLERRMRAGVIAFSQEGGQTSLKLADVLDLKRAEDARNSLMVEINQAMEGSETARPRA